MAFGISKSGSSSDAVENTNLYGVVRGQSHLEDYFWINLVFVLGNSLVVKSLVIWIGTHKKEKLQKMEKQNNVHKKRALFTRTGTGGLNIGQKAFLLKKR